MCSTAGHTNTSVAMERRLVDYYELGGVIGEGGFGSVCAGTCRQNGDTVSHVDNTVKSLLYMKT